MYRALIHFRILIERSIHSSRLSMKLVTYRLNKLISFIHFFKLLNTKNFFYKLCHWMNTTEHAQQDFPWCWGTNLKYDICPQQWLHLVNIVRARLQISSYIPVLSWQLDARDICNNPFNISGAIVLGIGKGGLS